MKQTLVFLVCATMLFGLCACDNSDSSSSASMIKSINENTTSTKSVTTSVEEITTTSIEQIGSNTQTEEPTSSETISEEPVSNETVVSNEPQKELHTPTLMEQEIFDLVNAARRDEGLPELKYLPDIYDLALIRAKEISQTFSHTRPNGGKFSSVFWDFGMEYNFDYCAENLGRYFTTAESVFDAFMKSESHKDALLSARADVSCIAVYESEEGDYFVCQFFLKKR